MTDVSPFSRGSYLLCYLFIIPVNLRFDYCSSIAAFFFSATLTALATPPPTTQLMGISSAPLIPQNATANANRFAPVAFRLCRYSV